MEISQISDSALQDITQRTAKFLLEDKGGKNVFAHIFTADIRHGSVLRDIEGKLIGAGRVGFDGTSDIAAHWDSVDCQRLRGYQKPPDEQYALELIEELRVTVDRLLRLDSRLNYAASIATRESRVDREAKNRARQNKWLEEHPQPPINEDDPPF